MKRLLFPVALEAVFIAAVSFMPNRSLYFYFLSYLGIIIYFRKDFSFRKQIYNITDIKGFWVPVVLTALGLGLCNAIKTRVLSQMFLMVPDGAISIWMPDSYPGITLFALTMVVMAPLSEELFFRKAMIMLPYKATDNPALTEGVERTSLPAWLRGVPFWVLSFVSLAASLVLCALTHATQPLGIVGAVIMALPLAVSYLLTRNMYVPLLVHIGFAVYNRIEPIIYVIMRLYLR